jgi:hypothetical protein
MRYGGTEFMSVRLASGTITHEGMVLKILEKSNPAWYSNYALVWNEATGGPEEVHLFTGPYGEESGTAKVDATPLIRAKFAKWLESASPELRELYGD